MNSNNATGFRASNKASREGSRKNAVSVKSSPESVRYPTRVYTGQDVPKSDRRVTKIINHTSHSMALQQYDSLSVRTPLQDNGIITCDKQWIHASTGDSDAPDSCDINITSDDEREHPASSHLDVERSQVAKCRSSFSSDECVIFVEAGFQQEAASGCLYKSRREPPVNHSSLFCGSIPLHLVRCPLAWVDTLWCVPLATPPSCSSGKGSSLRMFLFSSDSMWCPSTRVLQPLFLHLPWMIVGMDYQKSIHSPPCHRIAGRPATYVERTAVERSGWHTLMLVQVRPVV